jgi:hypothetical protein
MSTGHIIQIVILGFVLAVTTIVVAGLITIEVREWIQEWKDKEDDLLFCDCPLCDDFYEKDRNDIS